MRQWRNLKSCICRTCSVRDRYQFPAKYMVYPHVFQGGGDRSFKYHSIDNVSDLKRNLMPKMYMSFQKRNLPVLRTRKKIEDLLDNFSSFPSGLAFVHIALRLLDIIVSAASFRGARSPRVRISNILIAYWYRTR